MKRAMYFLIVLGCFELRASSLEMLMSGKIVSIQDSKTGSQTIQKGGAAKAKVLVTLVAGGAQEKDLRQSLKQSVPRVIKGWLEARQSNSGQLVQAVPVTFLSHPDSVKCKNTASGDKMICQMSYLSNNNNYVEIPATMSGNYSLSVNLKAPQSGAPIYSKNSSGYEFWVEGQGSRSFASFAGLPEN